MHLQAYFSNTLEELSIQLTVVLILIMQLLQLDLRSNHFLGTISPSVGLLTNLVSLSLADNMLSGVVPKELASLSKLRTLTINGNPNLTGSLPEEVCWGQDGLAQIVADCASSEATGLPPNVVCPCCTMCCDGATGICQPQ